MTYNASSVTCQLRNLCFKCTKLYTHISRLSSILNIVIADNGDENKRKGKCRENGNEKNIGLEMEWKWERFHENGKNSSHSRTISARAVHERSSADPPTKESVDVLAPFLVELYNRSMSTGVVPAVFKAAYVTPLLKKSWLRSGGR